ncbi:hypothetical protein [Dietzia sp. ANT_WB102]|uniref:hypothetical protein n=1 Tax=Dietzia sp. ANT_WB102 TaxID=2597345 RepID=UPI002102C68B|nr:hypothetical protein [Dietzia sp. ANT_WB102]
MSSPPNGPGWGADEWVQAPYGGPAQLPRRNSLVWAMGALIVVLLIALAGVVGYLLAAGDDQPTAAFAPPSSTEAPSADAQTPTPGSSEESARVGSVGGVACDPDEIADDAGIDRRNVNVDRCLGDWALAHVYVPPGEPAGDTQYIVSRLDGAWSRYTSIPSSVCRDDAERDGMPGELLTLLNQCPRLSGATGDLGLSTPMTRPACDGRGIVVLFSAVTPGAYAQEIASALDVNPGASYLRTDMACPSLRSRDENGNVIYAVYRPSGYTRQELCRDVRAAGPPAYGRWLDTTSDPSDLVVC